MQYSGPHIRLLRQKRKFFLPVGYYSPCSLMTFQMERNDNNDRTEHPAMTSRKNNTHLAMIKITMLYDLWLYVTTLCATWNSVLRWSCITDLRQPRAHSVWATPKFYGKFDSESGAIIWQMTFHFDRSFKWLQKICAIMWTLNFLQIYF